MTRSETIAKTKRPILVPPDCIPDASNLVTEDDTPVDNFFSEKQQRLLTEPLYSCWLPTLGETDEPRDFLAAANVGIYYALREPPLVPDVFLSLDATAPDDWWEKNNRCYMTWEIGKEPEVVIEIVSNLKGGELSEKLDLYARRLHSRYYVVFDPSEQYGSDALRIFRNADDEYKRVESIRTGQRDKFPLDVGLWSGVYEGSFATWLRWRDAAGVVIPTGKERAEQERLRAEQAEERVVLLSALAEQERAAKERLAAKLRALGFDPDTL